jgi:AraC family transcriptional regulator of adaptative response/methylated-DNA-[protein]-cysteine methyltransferase
MNQAAVESQRAYLRIASAIRFLAERRHDQPGLAEIGAHVGLSESHLQREFTRWAGVSPKQFLKYLTKESAKRRLRDATVMDAALDSGLSGPGRLHDLMISCEAMTPGEYKRGGAGLRIRYGVHPSPFGHCLIAATERGICKLTFADGPDDIARQERELHAEWRAAAISRDDESTAALAGAVFGPASHSSLELLLKGSPFQLKVWEALLSIPEGRLASYQQVADMIGRPAAVRAVASAIGRNDIAYLIPCHRVIRSNGEFSQYRWGSERKQALIGWEAARQRASVA